MPKHKTKRSTKTLAESVTSIEDGVVTARIKVVCSTDEVDIKFDESVLETHIVDMHFVAEVDHTGVYRIKASVEGNTQSGKTTVYLSRLIMRPPKNMVVDHINHDCLDNRTANLRVCTVTQNAQNRKGAAAHSKTGVLGVYLNNRNPGTFFSCIVVDKKKILLGTFDSIKEARTARVRAEKRFFGAYAPQR